MVLGSFKLIAENQTIQEKLRSCLKTAYVEAVAESRLPTANEIIKTNVPYLDAVIEECLRVGNPVRVLHREAMVDTTLLGHPIPKGTTVFFTSEGPGFKIPALSMDGYQRSESSQTKFRGGEWDPNDIHTFNPERWLEEDDKHNTVFNPHAGPFITFSLGPRGCFGKKLAYMEIRMVIVLLIWNFHFKKLSGQLESHEVIEGITTAPKHCYVALEKVV
jgi:cytochrome P450